MAHVEQLAGSLAPDVFCQIGIVYEGIAVVLEIADGIGTLDFLLRDGIHAMPLDEHFLFPRLKLQIVVVLHGKLTAHVLVVQSPAVVLRAHIVYCSVCIASVARSHVEIGTGKIALVLVLRFKDIEIHIQRVVVNLAHFERTGIRLEVLHGHPQGIVAA